MRFKRHTRKILTNSVIMLASLLITLKSLDVIKMSWTVVTSPIWIGGGLWVLWFCFTLYLILKDDGEDI
jgi:hypothetical protein